MKCYVLLENQKNNVSTTLFFIDYSVIKYLVNEITMTIN